MLNKCAVSIKTQHKQILRFTREGNPISLSCFHLNHTTLAATVVALSRCDGELYAIVVSSERLPQTTYHMAIGCEVAPWKHCLEFVYRLIYDSEKLWKTLFIHGILPSF